MRIRFAGLRPSTILVFLILSAPVSAAGMDQAKHDDIKLLIKELGELDDAQRAFERSFAQSIAGFRKQKPNVPEQLWDAISAEAHRDFIDSLPELEEPIIAIYDDNYSEDEIKQLLAFYRSPIGQKVIAQAPHIQEQSFAVGKVWGERLGRQLADSIRESARRRGYEL